MASYGMSNATSGDSNKDVKWIPNFLQWRYFSTFCHIHGKALSKFCTTCEVPLCPQCVKGTDQDHQGHDIIQISRYEGKELVVKSSLISNYIQCHDIQPYMINTTPVLALQPMVSLGDTGSRGGDKEKRYCGVCGTNLASDYDQSVRFCSIYCKVTAYAHSSDGSMPTLFVAPETQPVMDNVIDGNDESGVVENEEVDDEGDEGEKAIRGTKEQHDDQEEQSCRRRSRSRKGTPHRAPFF